MRYERLPLAPHDFLERLETLRFGFGKWDLHVDGRNTVMDGALVLTAEEHRAAVHAAEDLARAAAGARRRLQDDPEDARRLGVPAEVAEAAAAEPRDRPVVTRIDLFRTRAGWQASEFNDDCPGGYNEALGLPAVFGDVVPAGLAVPGDLPEALAALLGDGPVGIAYATGYAEDLQVAELLVRLLHARGIDTVAASPAHLETDGPCVTLLGRPVATVLRFFPSEWLPLLPNWGTWRRLAASGAALVNPLAAALTQSKAIHLWLREHGDASVRRYLPETSMLDEVTAQSALQRPHAHVLKPAFGRMAEGVVLGAACPPRLWRKRVKGALLERRTRPYVVQRKFDPVPVETGAGTAGTACLGAYVVDGRFAGYYSRFARGPLVAYDASNVLTLVETA